MNFKGRHNSLLENEETVIHSVMKKSGAMTESLWGLLPAELITKILLQGTSYRYLTLVPTEKPTDANSPGSGHVRSSSREQDELQLLRIRLRSLMSTCRWFYNYLYDFRECLYNRSQLRLQYNCPIDASKKASFDLPTINLPKHNDMSIVTIPTIRNNTQIIKLPTTVHSVAEFFPNGYLIEISSPDHFLRQYREKRYSSTVHLECDFSRLGTFRETAQVSRWTFVFSATNARGQITYNTTSLVRRLVSGNLTSHQEDTTLKFFSGTNQYAEIGNRYAWSGASKERKSMIYQSIKGVERWLAYYPSGRKKCLREVYFSLKVLKTWFDNERNTPEIEYYADPFKVRVYDVNGDLKMSLDTDDRITGAFAICSKVVPEGKIQVEL